MTKLYLIGLFCISLFLLSCKHEGSNSALPSSSGKYGEVLVVVDTSLENGVVGEKLQAIFYESLLGMPQKEPQFRVATVSPKGFKSILKRSRNILKLDVKKASKKGVQIVRDAWAKDQLLIKISAQDQQTIARILSKNKQTIRDYFNEEEISRLKRQFKTKCLSDIEARIKEKAGLSLTIPSGFVKMLETENGLWIKKEKQVGQHQVIQGLSIYIEPYTTDSVFSSSAVTKSRNKFTKNHIEGFRENSYMAVFEDYSLHIKELNLNGVYAKEYRGLWNMKNDFMGGPFLHFVFVDEENNKAVHLDGFVYAPKFNKREYLRELEAIMRTSILKD